MSAPRPLVLDANILIRAALGPRARGIIERHADHADFFVPVYFADEAREHLPAIVAKRGFDNALVLAALNAVLDLVHLAEAPMYAGAMDEALARLAGRDPFDTDVLALALTLECPIWTEDRDFFRNRRGDVDKRTGGALPHRRRPPIVKGKRMNDTPESRIGLRITQLSGPGAGAESKVHYGDDIRIGRNPANEVAFGPEVTAIARDAHVKIVKDAGRYELRIDSEHRVRVDGTLAMDGQELPPRCVLALGPRGDIRLQVEIVRPGHLPATEKQSCSTDDTSTLKQAWRVALLAAVVAVVVVAGGLLGVKWWSERVNENTASNATRIDETSREVAAVDTKVQEVADDFAKSKAAAEALDNPADALASSLRNSVYLVVAKNQEGKTQSLATAWVIGENTLPPMRTSPNP